MFTQDSDFLVEARRRHIEGIAFAGVVYAHQLRVTIGRCISDLELPAKAAEFEEFVGRVDFLPL